MTRVSYQYQWVSTQTTNAMWDDKNAEMDVLDILRHRSTYMYLVCTRNYHPEWSYSSAKRQTTAKLELQVRRTGYAKPSL